MAGRNPAGFDPAAVLEGLHTAMQFGAPNRDQDKATFCWVEENAATGTDEDGVPFDPTQRTTKTPRRLVVPCAIDYTDGADRTERFGQLTPSRIEVTLLDPDYRKVEPFTYVVWGGDKYVRRTTRTDALGSLDVWTIECRAEDDR